MKAIQLKNYIKMTHVELKNSRHKIVEINLTEKKESKALDVTAPAC